MAAMHTARLVGCVDGDVSCSAWDPTCTRWAAGTSDGTVRVWEKEIDGTPSMRLLASWQAGSNNSQAITHIRWAPLGWGSQLAVCCSSLPHPGEQHASPGRREQQLQQQQVQQGRATTLSEEAAAAAADGDITIWGVAGGVCEQQQQQGSCKWRRRAVLRPQPSWQLVAHTDTTVPASATAQQSRIVVAMEFVARPAGSGCAVGGGGEEDNEDEAMALRLAAVTAGGKMLVYRSSNSICSSPTWDLEADVCITPDAITSPFQLLLTSASLAVCATLAPGRPLTLAIATRGLQRRNTSVKVWVHSGKFMRWLAAADLSNVTAASSSSVPSSLPASGYGTMGDFLGPNPTSTQQASPAEVNHVAWRPNFDARPYDVVALSTTSGVFLLKLSSSSPSQHGAPASADVDAERLPIEGNFRDEVTQVSWHLSGVTFAAVSVRGVVGVWKESPSGVWAPQATLTGSPGPQRPIRGQ